MVGLRQEGVRLQNLVLDAERKIVSIVPDRYTRTERSPQGDLSVFSKQQLHKLRQAYEVSAGELLPDADFEALQGRVRGCGTTAGEPVQPDCWRNKETGGITRNGHH